MLEVSDAYRNAIAQGSRQETKAALVLPNGTSINLDGDELAMGGMTVMQSTSPAMRFALGSAIIGTVRLTLANYERQWDAYRFGDALLTVYSGMLTGGSIEWLMKGKYIVEQPDSYGATIRLTCYDFMSKLERPYKKVGTAFPATLKTIVKDICNKCGVELRTKTFPHCTYVVNARHEDLDDATCLEVVSWVAQVAGCFADVDPNGRLRIRWYDSTTFETEGDLDGGTYDTASKPYSDGNSEDGGSFMSGGTSKNGGAFSGSAFVNASAIKALTVNTDDKTITGLQVTASDNTDSDDFGEQVLYGSDGYLLKITDNPLVEYGRAQEVADMLGTQLVGMAFRPFSATVVADPTIEAGDAVKVSDYLGRTCDTYATQVDWNASGSSRLSLGAESVSTLDAVKRRTKKEKEADKNRQELEKAKKEIEKLKKDINEIKYSSSGTQGTTPSTNPYTIPTYTAPDGNEYTLGVDENGNPVMTMVPSEIRVTTLPNKTSYKYNEKIDYTGIVVSLYDANGNPFTDSRYPNGTIPFVELGFPKEYANEIGSADGTIDPERIEWTCDLPYMFSAAGTYLGYMNGRTFTKTSDGKAVGIWNSQTNPTWSGPCLISPVRNNVEYSQGWGIQGTCEYQGVTWYINARWHWPSFYPNNGPEPTFNSSGSTNWAVLGPMMLEAAGVRVISIPGSPECIVSWQSPYTQEYLYTTFMISVAQDTWVQKGDGEHGWSYTTDDGFSSSGGGDF